MEFIKPGFDILIVWECPICHYRNLVHAVVKVPGLERIYTCENCPRGIEVKVYLSS